METINIIDTEEFLLDNERVFILNASLEDSLDEYEAEIDDLDEDDEDCFQIDPYLNSELNNPTPELFTDFEASMQEMENVNIDDIGKIALTSYFVKEQKPVKGPSFSFECNSNTEIVDVINWINAKKEEFKNAGCAFFYMDVFLSEIEEMQLNLEFTHYYNREVFLLLD